MTATRIRRFTGWHMTAILVSFFGIVIVVNFMMARFAVTTFGGVVVENSYVASEHFNRWLDEAAKEKALGWQAQSSRESDGRVRIVLTKTPASMTDLAGITLTAVARHPLGTIPDRDLTFARQADGSFISVKPLPKERWRLRLTAQAGPRTWRSEIDVA
ncbi:MAG: FixH family protein [Novosphingobium sp.]